MIKLPICMQEGDDDDDTPQEWSLLELNGELITPDKVPTGDTIELGSVKFDAEVSVFTGAQYSFHQMFFGFCLQSGLSTSFCSPLSYLLVFIMNRTALFWIIIAGNTNNDNRIS